MLFLDISGDMLSEYRAMVGFGASTELLVLHALSKGEAHGYEIIKRIREEFVFPRSPGVLYPVLRKLLRRGLIEEADKVSRGGRAVKVYRLTERGREYLVRRAEEIEELKRLAAGVKLLRDIGGEDLAREMGRLVKILHRAGPEEVREIAEAIADFIRRVRDVRIRLETVRD